MNIFLDCTWTTDNTCGGANGDCVQNGATFECDCKNGYTGDSCNTAPTGKHLNIVLVDSPEKTGYYYHLAITIII